MQTFLVRNRLTRMTLCEVSVDDPEHVLEAAAQVTGSSIEEIAKSLGRNVEEAMEALDIVPVLNEEPDRRRRVKRFDKQILAPRRLYAKAS